MEKKIQRELETKLKTRHIVNMQRRDKRIPTIAVFGYTNVGKTSFIKVVTDDQKMMPENKLFATLDVTYHGTSLSQSTQNVIFIDTIGFISDIPYNLVEAFKTSLADALNADVVVHLIDLSHPDRVAQEKTVEEILTELAPDSMVPDKVIKIYNKCDRVKDLDTLIAENKDNANTFFISCKTGYGLGQLKQLIEENIYKRLKYIEIYFEIAQGSDEMAYLYKHSIVKELKQCPNSQCVLMHVLVNKVNVLKFVKLFPHVKMLPK